MNEFIDPDLVFVFSFFQKLQQIFTATGFKLVKKFAESLHAGRNIQEIIFSKVNTVGWIKSYEVVIVGCTFVKAIEILFQSLWHPIPARAHIENKIVRLKLSGAASRQGIFFK